MFASREDGLGDACLRIFKEAPHYSARANPEKNWILTMTVFHRNILFISRKSDEVRAQLFLPRQGGLCAAVWRALIP
jgi:hypothetical protein